MRKLSTVFSILLFCLPIQAQILASFESDHPDLLSLGNTWYDSALFVSQPGVYTNPDPNGLNESEQCFGAVNVSSADWWGNFFSLKLNEPITISSENRFLSFMVYRGLQPKEFRLGFNGYEENEEIYFGKTTQDKTWEKVTVDLFSKFGGAELNELWIIFSCNWYQPRSGWEEAAYYFDNFQLTGTSTETRSVSIDPSRKYQSIEGFGASDCWTANFIGQWEDEPRNFTAQKLFSQDFDSNGNPLGIGLSMWRFNLGAGTYEQGVGSNIEDLSRRAESFLDAYGNYNWSKQAGQQFFLNEAKRMGCEHFVAFSNSPPVSFTKNGKGYADPGGACNLADDKFDDFAAYLTDVLQYFKGQGIDFKYLSPVNEPQYDWTSGQEGSPWTNEDIKKLAQEIDAAIQAKDLNTNILLAEAGYWKSLYQKEGRASQQLFEFFRSSSDSYIGDLASVEPAISAHSYWTHHTNQEIEEVRKNVKNYTEFQFIKPHQTEWSMLGAEPDASTGFPRSYGMASGMDIALFMAKIIQSDLVFAEVASWSFWTAMDMDRFGHKNRFSLIKVTPANGSYGSILQSGTAEDLTTLWALGNFSRFIRPGYNRIRIDEADEMNGLFGSAYVSPDEEKIVAVYVNTSYSNIELSTQFKNLDKPIKTIAQYTTSSVSKLERDQFLAELYDESPIQVPARSVSTIVYDRSTSSRADFEEANAKNDIELFPNPVSLEKEFFLVVPKTHESIHLEISVYDMLGSLILTKIHSGRESKVLLSLPEKTKAGMYMAQVKSSSSILSAKFLVQ